MVKITPEEARWLRQLVGSTQKKAPEVIQRRLLSLNLVVKNTYGMDITEEGRLVLQRSSAAAP